MKSGPKGKLLLVGPDDFARMLLESHFESQGYRVRSVDDAEEALAFIESAPPDVVVEQGFVSGRRSVAAELGEGSAIPVVVLAEAGSEGDAAIAGAAETITLPAPRPRVATAVEGVLARSRETNPSPGPPADAPPRRGTLPYEMTAAAPKLERVGRYVVRGLLGRGGSGNVYRCWDPNLDRLVAVKTIRHQVVGDVELSRQVVERFKREAAASARLVHPGIVATHDFGLDEGIGVMFLAMELVDGPSLRSLIREGPMPTDAALSFGYQMADALAHAHEHDVIHRDVKPENVLIARQTRAKITDFGLARIGRNTLSGRSYEVFGTPRYMAPEQILNRSVDLRTDQFPLGAVIVELLSGVVCFPGEDVSARLYAVLEGSPPRLGDLGVEAPADLQAVLDRMLAKTPDYRFQTDAELLEALASVGRDLGLHLQRA